MQVNGYNFAAEITGPVVQWIEWQIPVLLVGRSSRPGITKVKRNLIDFQLGYAFLLSDSIDNPETGQESHCY